jgi:hypothetical protein
MQIRKDDEKVTFFPTTELHISNKSEIFLECILFRRNHATTSLRIKKHSILCFFLATVHSESSFIDEIFDGTNFIKTGIIYLYASSGECIFR